MSKETADEKVMAAVLECLPGGHLEIWSKVKKSIPEVHPAHVWRCLNDKETLTYDREKCIYSRKSE